MFVYRKSNIIKVSLRISHVKNNVWPSQLLETLAYVNKIKIRNVMVNPIHSEAVLKKKGWLSYEGYLQIRRWINRFSSRVVEFMCSRMKRVQQYSKMSVMRMRPNCQNQTVFDSCTSNARSREGESKWSSKPDLSQFCKTGCINWSVSLEIMASSLNSCTVGSPFCREDSRCRNHRDKTLYRRQKGSGIEWLTSTHILINFIYILFHVHIFTKVNVVSNFMQTSL